ncbi:MAG: type II toxin-antitoxin system HicA family toxin [Spirochaetota bacterium]|nr:type II toxin-antitoxin system HicA family toxin [Spirochaetota bacterium]
MKRYVLIKHLKKNNCKLLREGKKHSVYYNTINKKTSSIPRHNEVGNNLVLKICKDLDINKP